MDATIIPVILCGGSGTRLWPVSRHYFPKQFHALTGRETLFQQTLRRCAAVRGAGEPVILSNGDYRFLVAEQMDMIGLRERRIILEPAARNTAPAIALAALSVRETDPEAVLLPAPSDHLITGEDIFRKTTAAAAAAAASGHLVTLGIAPSGPATGYGYIKREPASGSLPEGCYRVEQFVEKPDAETASRFIREGTYLWNSGMFLFTAAAYLDELGKFQPQMLEACTRAWSEAQMQYGFTSVGEAYAEAASLSVDYAVMEHTDKAVVVPYTGDWNDIGSWSGLADGDRADDAGNTVSGNVRLHNVRNSFVSASDRLVAGVGLDNAVIVETKDAVLVSTQSEVQDVKRIVEALKADGAAQADYHTRVYRPWGSYEDLDKGEGFHVKRLTIKPGASISLQRHFHRSEHWVVVQGEAAVVRDQEQFVLKKNESTFIPQQAVHKLTNHGSEDLVIVEVQTGDYLDESDIERLKDDYGRS